MIYFDNSSTSFPKAPGVAKKAGEILENGCFNINRGGYAGAYEMGNIVYDTRQKLAAMFDCPKGKLVVFNGGITLSINMVLKGLLKKGDHVVTTMMEHNAVLRPLSQLIKNGVKVDYARCDINGNLDLDDIKKNINKNTKLVVVNGASNVCGTILPIKEIGAICRGYGIPLFVDSAQIGGVIPISMVKDNIDIIAFTAHKGLLGPQGLGGLMFSGNIADRIEPLIAGGTGSYSHLDKMPKELPDKFEAGTLNLPSIAALGIALDYINKTGISNIYNREMELYGRFVSGINNMDGVRLVGRENKNNRCAIAAYDFLGRDNAMVSSKLSEKYAIMTRCGLHCAPMAHKALGTYPRGVVRFSFGHKNTEKEVDEAILAIEEILKEG